MLQVRYKARHGRGAAIAYRDNADFQAKVQAAQCSVAYTALAPYATAAQATLPPLVL